MGYFEYLAEIRYQEAVREGFLEGQARVVRSLLMKTKLSPKEIARILNISLIRVRKIKAELNKK